MASVLVTGGAGYVGSHTVLHLRDRGHRVVCYDDLSTGRRDLAALADVFVAGDVRDRDALAAAMRAHDVDAVVHCAALSIVPESARIPELYYEVNVGGTAALLAACRGAGVRAFVFSSTATVYGAPETVPITESARTHPISPYGRSKLAVEQLLEDFQRSTDVGVTIFRYFNAAGADGQGRAGEEHDPETHLIPNILRPLAAGGSSRLTIFGTDYPTDDGTCVRDYVHVTDIAEAHRLGIERARSGGLGVFNLGSGCGYSVKQVVDAAVGATGLPITPDIGPRRAGDPPVLVADTARAREQLGWTADHSDLGTILRTAWAWHSRRAR